MPFELFLDRGIDRPVLCELDFCGVTFLMGRGERNGAVVAVSIRPDGAGLLPAVKAIGHPPELGSCLARFVRVRRDQEIETAAGRVERS